MADNSPFFESFLAELQKIAASKHRLSVSKTRAGRRSLSVSTMLKKDKEGTLFKKHAGDELVVLEKKLHPGDILLTRAVKPTLMSRLVSKVQNSEFGHASLYIGKGKVIDTRLSEGVFQTPLSEVHGKWGGGRDIRAYRPDVSDEDRAKAVETAKSYVGTPYSRLGALRLVLPAAENKGVSSGKKDALVCSQLITQAYPQLNVAKGKHRDHVLPVDFAKSPLTKLVGELKKEAEPAWKDQLPGGLADKKTPKDFSAKSLQQGVKVELEHTKNKTLAKEIAMDHLSEDASYYPKLERMEKSAFSLQGHTTFQGLPIAIENDKGSVRKGVDPDGKKWRTVFKYPYGYIKNTEGNDGEEIDAYLGPDKQAPQAFVVHQRKLDSKKHDEDKVMLGFTSSAKAKAAYLEHYNKVGPQLFGGMTTIVVADLKKKLEEKRKHTKLAMATAAYVDRDEKLEDGVTGDVPSRDGAKPGAPGTEKTEDGRGSATTLPTNGALMTSGTGVMTRL